MWINRSRLHFINAKLSDHLKDNNQNADIALELRSLIANFVLEGNKPIVDWKLNDDLVKKIWNELDDYFYSISLEFQENIPFDLIDAFIEEVIKIAKKTDELMDKIEYRYGSKTIEAEVLYSNRKTLDLRMFREVNVQITAIIF